MKVRELCHVLADADPEATVLLASDAEGNRCSPLASVSTERYRGVGVSGAVEVRPKGLVFEIGLVLWPRR